MSSNKRKNSFLIVTAWDHSLSLRENESRMLKLLRVAEEKGYYVEIAKYLTEENEKEVYILTAAHKTDNELRFEGIAFNNMFKPKQDCCFIKYSDEDSVKFLKYTGHEKPCGKVTWGAGDNFSFLKENMLFTFE